MPDETLDSSPSASPDANDPGGTPGEDADVNILSGAPPPKDVEAVELPSDEQSQETEESPGRSRLGRALARWGPANRFLWYRSMRRAKRDVRAWGRFDSKHNESGRLPDDERVEVPILWVAELYTPSTIAGLLEGIGRLGWEYGRTRSDSLVKWMGDVRRGRRAGWTSLGLVSSDDGQFMREREATLPGGVTAALPVLLSISPSLTALVVGFMLSDEQAGCLGEPLHAFYRTRTENDPRFRPWQVIAYILWNGRLHSGETIYDPDRIRRSELRSRLKSVETKCTAWVADSLPGVFASGASGSEFPTAVLFVTEGIEPLSEAVRGMRALYGLSLDRDYDSWESEDEWPRGRLVLPRTWDDEGLRLVFGCRRRDAFADNAGYHDPDSNWTIAYRADQLVRGLLVRWTLSCALDGYHEMLSTLRDKAAGRHFYRPVSDLKSLRSLVRAELYDIAVSANEVRSFAKSDRAYRHDVIEMKYNRLVGNDKPDLLKSLQRSQQNRAAQLIRDSGLLQSQLSVTSDITQTISNIRIQRLIVWLTSASIVIAVVALLVALKV